MVYGIYQSAAGMQVNQYRQEVLANNLANASTVGFKPDIAVVKERAVASREDLTDVSRSNAILDRMTGGSFVAPTYTSFEQGSLERTGRPLDAAISGEGFFVVGDGKEKRYTRDGRFTIDAGGQVVTVAGRHPVLDESGQPIVVPSSAAGQARIDANGEIRAGQASYGRVEVVKFDDKTEMVKAGGNLFQAFAQPKSTEASLQAGSVENSAVNATQMMVSMIEVTRAYQFNSTMVGLADSTLGRAVNDIARLR